MPRYGNTSVSALLNQARAALKKQQSYEEEIASYEYDLSPKDQAAYDKYASFLSKRAKEVQTTDPTKSLSLQRALTGANRSFTSSEIQRQSIYILEGTGTKQSKLQTLIGLYKRALENGDEATAQRIQLQADQLQQSINSEASAGRSGGSGGGSTAAKKGINATIDKIDLSQKALQADLRSGKIDDKTYIAKIAQLYDAKDKTLGGAYTVDSNGFVLPNAPGLDNSDAEDFYKKHDSLLNDGKFQQILGTDRNIPFELRMAQIGGAFKTKFDPKTGEVSLEAKNAVGQRRLTEFGSNLATPTVDDNPNGKYAQGFKALGLTGGERGSITKTYTDFKGGTREGQFYLDNPDKPNYAYTQDENGVRYALNKDGQAVMLGDSAAASKQYEVLQARLQNPNISQQERDAIQNDIINLNTDMVPQDILKGNAEAGAQNASYTDNLATAVPYLAGKVVDEAKRDAGSLNNLFTGVAKNKLISSVLSNGGKFIGGAANALGLPAFFNQQQQKIDVLKAEKARADAAEAQRRADLEARSRAALAAIAPAAVPNFRTNTVQNAPGPYRIPAATQKAAETVGTPQFTQKYAFPGIDLNKYLKR